MSEKDVKEIVPELKKYSQELRNIPLKQPMEITPKVLVVGEIYVRRDDFAVDELIGFFADKGIIAKISGFTEWVYYCDFVREYELKNDLRRMSFFKRPFSKAFREWIVFKIELAYKHWVDKKIKTALKESDLLPDSPHNMKEIMKTSKEEFVSYALNSEISVSSGAAAVGIRGGYSGVVNISPFACLIGRVIEGLITPWFRERKYPVMSIEIDGNLLPPNIISKLEIFSLNVKRFKSSHEISDFVVKSVDESIEGKKEEVLVS